MLAWLFAGIFISFNLSSSSLLVMSNSFANSCTRMLAIYQLLFPYAPRSAEDTSAAIRSNSS